MNQFDIEALSTQRVWASRLARQLVQDSHLAEDVAQEASIAAWHEGEGIRHLGSWMRSTVWRISRRNRETEDARRRREACRARPDSVASASDVAIRFEEQHMLSEAVRSLPEAQRDVVLLRFYEGLAPRQIAKRLDVPVERVYTQLKRALKELRRKLDATHGGDRSAWVSALLPIARMKTTSFLGSPQRRRRSIGRGWDLGVGFRTTIGNHR